MRLTHIGVAYCLMLLVPGPAARSEETASSSDAPNAAIRRALPYLARQTGAWIEKNKCTSCHQVPHGLWAMNEARARGFDVDDRLAEWNRWSVNFVLGQAEKSDEDGPAARERADELSQMLLIGSTADLEAERDMRDRLVSLLLDGQAPDGGWRAGGQLPGQKRPQEETDEATTMWSLYALRSSGHRCENLDTACRRARGTLAAPSTSLEHLVLRYLLARDDEERATAAELQNRILTHQNDDGGWGWLLTGESDAIATGKALYALSRMAPEHAHGAIRRARAFLLRTQQDDGSWHAPSTLQKEHGEPSVIANDWGTAWALIGLTRTMER